MESPSQGQEYFSCGDFSGRTAPPVYQTDSGYTLQLVYLLVFGSPVAAYLNLQSKHEDRDEKMEVKCSSSDWCSLEQAVFGHTGLPVCLHHIRGPQTLPVLLGHAGRVDIHPFFLNPLPTLWSDFTWHDSLAYIWSCGWAWWRFSLLLLFFLKGQPW